jgi:hypothetical protein
MANYNTFCLVETKARKLLLITSSARMCKRAFAKGCRIEVWNANNRTEVIYNRNIADFGKYIKAEKEYIANKQRKAEARNRKRKHRLATVK